MAQLLSGVRYIDALIFGVDGLRWNRDEAVGSPASVSYSFLDTLPAYAKANGDATQADFRPFTPAQREAAVGILQQYAEIAHLTFEPQPDDAAAQIHFALNDQGSESLAYAYPPYRNYEPAGDVWLSTSAPGNDDLAPGEQGYATLLHEIGHALGLKHPFDAERTGVTLSGVENTEEYTVMAYRLHPYATFYTAGGDEKYIEASTPMLYDIAAIQYLYGANETGRAGDNVYSFAPHKPFFMCLWDGGGTDTVSVARFTLGCDIDLRDGHFSDVTILSAAPPVGGGLVYDGTDNLSIAFGAVIENATGGAGDDVLRGNAVANVLRGNAGDDTLAGGVGADRLIGGDGADTFAFSSPGAGDVVGDFVAGTDHLQFDGARFTGLAGLDPDQMFAQHYLDYDGAAGLLYYDADGNGSAEDPVLVAKFNGHPAIGPADITLV
jgi:serralysin